MRKVKKLTAGKKSLTVSMKRVTGGKAASALRPHPRQDLPEGEVGTAAA